MDQQAPKLVVHTTVAKTKEETVGILDGLWACLLNDYLLDPDEEEESSDSSLSGDSLSTAALRAERRRISKMQKRERRKQRLYELEKESEAFQLGELPPMTEGRLLQNMESSAYSKGNLLDVASKRLDVVKKNDSTKKKKKSRDKYELPSASTNYETLRESIQEKPRVIRTALEPDGSVSSLSMSLSKPSLSKQWLESGKSQASSIDADGKIARKEWKKTIEKRSDVSARRLSRSIHLEQRLDQNGVMQSGSQDHPIDIERDEEPQNKSWHSRRDLFASSQMGSGSYHERKTAKIGAYESAVERKPSSPKPKDRLPRREPPSQLDKLDAARLGTSQHRRSSNFTGTMKDDQKDLTTQRDDARDTEEHTWALDEDRVSELDMIRQKKLDRKEALMRIRAIKARIAKLET